MGCWWSDLAHLRDSSGGLGQLCGDSLLPQGSAEKCVRQVAHQMMHLRNVWGGGVLPESIYKRAVGTVFNSVIEELIGKVWPLSQFFCFFVLESTQATRDFVLVSLRIPCDIRGLVEVSE